jgi:hypothetical protein
VNVRYQREMSRNYMIIRAPETAEKHSFECRMLSENAIRGLLGFHESLGENGTEYYYEITSRQPLSRIMEGRKLKAADIRRIVSGILDTVSSLDEYLLCEDQLLLEPEYIYTDPDRMDVKLCLLPGYSRGAPEAVSALLRVILEHTDHQDAEGIMIAYNLYEKSLRDNYGARDLLGCLGGDNRVFPDGAEDAGVGENADGGELGDIFDSRPLPEENPDPAEDRSSVSGAFLKAGKYGTGLGRGRAALTGVLLLAAAEGFLWYLGGAGIFRKAGPWIPAAAVAAAGLVILVRSAAARAIRREAAEERSAERGPEEQPGKEKRAGQSRKDTSALRRKSPAVRYPEEENPEAGGNPRKFSSPVWTFQPESTEEYRARMEKEREEQMDRSQAEGTVLLSMAPGGGKPSAVLEPLSGGEKIVITYSPFVVGQHRDLTDFCLDFPTVSRLHARFSVESGEASVTDLNSRNGTTVNGRKVEANETVPVGDGDTIYLADVGFRFHLLGDHRKNHPAADENPQN